MLRCWIVVNRGRFTTLWLFNHCTLLRKWITKPKTAASCLTFSLLIFSHFVTRNGSVWQWFSPFCFVCLFLFMKLLFWIWPCSIGCIQFQQGTWCFFHFISIFTSLLCHLKWTNLTNVSLPFIYFMKCVKWYFIAVDKGLVTNKFSFSCFLFS